ncbi:unnamed protein product [Phytophthora lilii]|uniref:Unnamed protein product n=1 Tax=Phytophthora lilii TaxID=2077276 RepID=A0A9W6U4A6_9STRA|nr:unnamed protein product [Phytophthora lilii]
MMEVSRRRWRTPDAVAKTPDAKRSCVSNDYGRCTQNGGSKFRLYLNQDVNDRPRRPTGFAAQDGRHRVPQYTRGLTLDYAGRTYSENKLKS